MCRRGRAAAAVRGRPAGASAPVAALAARSGTACSGNQPVMLSRGAWPLAPGSIPGSAARARLSARARACAGELRQRLAARQWAAAHALLAARQAPRWLRAGRPAPLRAALAALRPHVPPAAWRAGGGLYDEYLQLQARPGPLQPLSAPVPGAPAACRLHACSFRGGKRAASRAAAWDCTPRVRPWVWEQSAGVRAACRQGVLQASAATCRAPRGTAHVRACKAMTPPALDFSSVNASPSC